MADKITSLSLLQIPEVAGFVVGFLLASAIASALAFFITISVIG